MKFKGCKHLDYDESKYPTCKLTNLYDDNFCWERPEGDKVQFCGQGRGRINGIFQCINDNEMPCFENQEQNTEPTSGS